MDRPVDLPSDPLFAEYPYPIASALVLFGGIADAGAEFGYLIDPLFVLCQAALETGNFTSSLHRNALNSFGMMHRSDPASPQIGATDSGFAEYADRYDAAWDYFKRQQDFGIDKSITDPLTYANAVKASGYAEDPDYIFKWMAIWNGIDHKDWAQAVLTEYGAPLDGGSGPDGGSVTGTGRKLEPWVWAGLAAIAAKFARLW